MVASPGLLHAAAAALLATTACAPPHASSDAGPGPRVDAVRTVQADAPSADSGQSLALEGTARTCAVTVRYHAPNASEVQLAGEFTGWGDAPIPMVRSGSDFELTLSPATHPTLQAGQRYAYKVIADGTWQLNPDSAYRAYIDGCLNSAFVVPDCGARPEVRAEPVTTTLSGSSGEAVIQFRLHSASDGVALTRLELTFDGAAVDLGRVTRSDLLYQLTLSGLEPGKHRVSIELTDADDRAADIVYLPFWIEAAPFQPRDALMYMLVVDRFANGDRANDAPEPATNVDYPANWHGGDLQGALRVLQSGYFEQLGVNMIWLSPINQQAAGAFDGRDDGRRYAGYHGYWPSRAREVEPRFGGNEALQAFVDEAHRRGIRVLLDLINNQVHEQHEYVATHPDWFRQFPDAGVCAITPGWDWSERPFDCLFAAYLPDINWTVAGAEQQFIADALYWIDEMNIDGYRIDAVKHVETNSIFNLRAATAERFEQGGTRVIMLGETAVTEGDSLTYGCGEHYSSGYDWINAYVGERGLDGQFDFPTHHQIQERLLHDELSYAELESVVSKLETQYTEGAAHVQFLGTHDSTRMASQAAIDSARVCRWEGDPIYSWDGSVIDSCSALASLPQEPAVYARLKRAFAVTMTLPGIPFIYYGDEIALPGGNDPDNRRDMLWLGDLSELSMEPSANAYTDSQAELRQWVRALGQARAASPALRRGRRTLLQATDTLYVYAYSGAESAPQDFALVAINRGAAVANHLIELPPELRGATDLLEAATGPGSAMVDDTSVTVTIPAGAATVFVGR